MGNRTGISWTTSTWNFVSGCTRVSPACDNCYAETLTERFRGVTGHYFENGFDIQLRPDKFDLPLRWTTGRKIFVNSLSDVFHEAVDDLVIARAFAIMAAAPQHTFQLLTKRHGRMRSLLNDPGFPGLVLAQRDWVAELNPAVKPDFTNLGTWPLPNVWLGVSVENQQWANIRIPALLATPAACRFLSMEPLLGPVNLLTTPDGAGVDDGRPTYWLTGKPTWASEGTVIPGGNGSVVGHDFVIEPKVDWVIVGGESGNGARLMEEAWALDLRDQCAATGTAFFFKQTGNLLAKQWGLTHKKGENADEWPHHLPQDFPVLAGEADRG